MFFVKYSIESKTLIEKGMMEEKVLEKDRLEIERQKCRTNEPTSSLDGGAAESSTTNQNLVGTNELTQTPSVHQESEEELVDKVDSSEEDESIYDGEAPPSTVAEDTAGGDVMDTEFSVAEDYLPVATMLTLPPISQFIYDSNIQLAVPHDEEEEKRKKKEAALRQRWCLATWLVAVVVVGVVLGVTMGSSSKSDSGNPNEPTPSPTTQAFASLKGLIASVSFDGGASLEDTDSPQYKSLAWLETNANIEEYPDWKLFQRYALGTFYYSTNGDEWSESGGWLSDDDECGWYSQAEDLETPFEVCNDDGAYAAIVLEKININGQLPAELALLSDSLGEFG